MNPPVRSRHRCAAPRAEGFTLIELLVALAILAVVAIMAWRGLDQIARGRDTLGRAMESERAMSQLFDQMHSDLLQAARDDEIGGPPVRNDIDVLQLVRELRLPGQPTRLEVVRYQLRDGQLLRYASPPLSQVGQLQDALAPDADLANWSAVELADGVTDAGIRLYLPQRGWVDETTRAQSAFNDNLKKLRLPLTGAGPLPRSVTGVELTLQIASQRAPLTRAFLVGE